jgi:hypothetical protein
MALQRFTETYKPDITTFNKFASVRKLTEADISKIEGSKHKLSESTQRYLEKNPLAKMESKTVYRMPISRYDWKNANGRIYSKKLWENVIANQKDVYQGGCGLADHPDDDKDGMFKEQSVVWLNLELNESDDPDEKIVFGECVFVGIYGHLAEEVLEAGGRVPFSSSGFGELEESDKSQVRWDTYMLERVSDIVLNPSQSVYGKKEHAINKNNVKESIESGKIKEEIAPMSEGTNSQVGKYSKLEERSFRDSTGKYLTEAMKIVDPSDRLQELEEIQGYFPEGLATDLLDDVTSKITEAKKEISIAIKEHVKLKETFDISSTEELKESIFNVATNLEFSERTVEEWKKLATGLQEKVKTLQAVNAALPTIKAYKEAVKHSETNRNLFIEKEKFLIEKLKLTEGKMNKAEKDKIELITELAKYSEKIESLKEYNKRAVSKINSLTVELTETKKVIASSRKRVQENKAKEEEINFKPSATFRNTYSGFNESSEVKEYYMDLVSRHGSKIVKYKETILSCKTLKEAMINYNKFLAQLDSSSTTKISEALEPEDRQALLESQTRSRIIPSKPAMKRMPGTWE